ncbi:MAG: hypothetical protein WAO83_11505 [Fuerstiella sp.]
MRFVLIGECAEAAFVADAIQASAQHSLISCCVDGPLAQELNARQIGFSLAASAEEAMTTSGAEAVIIAVGDADRSTQLVRQASQADLHVVVLPPDDVSIAFSYEVHLLLDESRLGILPLTGRWYLNPNAGGISKALPDAAGVRSLALECVLCTDEVQQRRSQLLGIDALCACGFQYNQVTGMDLPSADGSLLSRTITLAATVSESESGAPPATLSFRQAANTKADVKLSVHQNNDSAIGIPTALPAPWASQLVRSSTTMLDRIVSRLQDADACQRGMVAFSNTLELKAGLDKSFRRRRTVDVYFDGVSERGAFKTQMTAIGCGVLTYVILGLVGFLIVAKVANLPPWALKTARVVWIAPVVLYLLAQLLLPLSRERGTAVDAKDDADVG